MLRTARPVSGESLSESEGVPSIRLTARRIARNGGLVGAVAALILGASSVVAATFGFATSGVVFTPTTVTHVDRSGYGWVDGIRTGQRVVEVSQDAVAGTVLVTEEAGGRFTSNSDDRDDGLRNAIPLALAAAAIAAVALAPALARRSWAAPLAIAAVLAAAEVLGRLFDTRSTIVGESAAVLAPTLYGATRPWLWRPARSALLALGVTYVVAWAVTRLAGSEVHELLDSQLGAIAFAGFLFAATAELAIGFRAGFLSSATRLRFVDAVILAAAAGIAIALWFLGFELYASAFVIAGAIAYPRLRRLIVRSIDRLLLSDVRERAAIESAEEERARLARDIHDTSLQELAGVIGQLETRPDTAGEGAALRRVADQLRRVTTELRPPILDDLGLGAALAFIADRTRETGLDVQSTIDDQAGLERATRAPSNVELAMFRIVEQALSNVVLHAEARRVILEGLVAADRVDVTVRDDGHGISRADLDEAARRGRLGLASMRRRAELIGATLDLNGAPGHGTTVRVRWGR